MRIYRKLHVFNKKSHNQGCLLVLPGRGEDARRLARGYYETGMGNLIVGITPEDHRWYPMPNGPDDQEDAVKGQEHSRHAIEGVMQYIMNEYGIRPEHISLTGFSAGAVMAIYTAAHCEHRLEAVIAHAGAILDPDSFPRCKHQQTPYFLFHNEDDQVFEWEERYLPMVRCLAQKNYQFFCIESDFGRHMIHYRDLVFSKFLLYHAKLFAQDLR